MMPDRTAPSSPSTCQRVPKNAVVIIYLEAHPVVSRVTSASQPDTEVNMSHSVTFSQKLAFALYESTEQYPVDFDEAWQWLGYTRKNTAKETFLSLGFVQKTDYEFDRTACKTPQGGRPSDSFRLTTECFKMWGMMAGTAQGRQVRFYFLQCERIAKENNACKTAAEILHEQTGLLVQQERRTKALEEQQKAQKVKNTSYEERLNAHDAELTRFNNTHGRYYSICGYAAMLKIPMPLSQAAKMGKSATAMCGQMRLPIGEVPDPRFGRVNTYPESVLQTLPW